MCISLNIKASLGDVIKEYCTPNTLDGENLYRCGFCDRPSRAIKRDIFEKASRVLVFHLNRFTFDGRKVNTMLEFPKAFNLRHFIQKNLASDVPINRREDCIYDLLGVVMHKGLSTKKGHYTSYIKGFDDKWYLADDSRITPVTINTVLSARAYMLFYHKRINSENDKSGK